MAIKVLGLHHHGVRVGPTAAALDAVRRFYTEVLSLSPDPGRPTIPSIEGYWMDVGGTAQIHLMGVEGVSGVAQGPDRDPSAPHVALAVPDVQEAKKELDRLGVPYFFTRGLVGPESEQIFLRDPAGNMIELHQAGTCRCVASERAGVGAMR